MATTAALTVVPSGTLTLNQPFTGSLAITNGTTGAINLTAVVPYAYDTAVGISSAPYCPLDPGDANLGPNAQIAVPHGSTLTIPIPFIPRAASTQPAYTLTGGPASQGSGAPLTTNSFTIGAILYFNDQTVIQATETTVTVQAPTMFNGR